MNETPGTPPKAKAPARPAAEIVADIQREREALSGSFASLRNELEEAAEAGRQRAEDASRKAAVIAPVVAGVLVSAAVLRLMLRRRSKNES